MHRRDFLINLAKTSALGLSVAVLPDAVGGRTVEPQANLRGTRFKGTPEGLILASLDQGRSWDLCADMTGFPILALGVRAGQLYARLGCGHYSFMLKSQDGRRWYTQQWEPPVG